MTSKTGLFDLTGLVAIVTGGGSGIGLDMADGLAAAGAHVILCARNVDRCRAGAAAITAAHGVRTLALQCDLRNAKDVEATVLAAINEFGRLDILVNNAGATWGAPVVDYPLDAWRKVVDINLTGTFLFCQAVGRRMIAAGSGGALINVASAAALSTVPPELMDAVGYNASKGGVISLTKDLAVKWARFGIRVNAIAPGWFPTDMSRGTIDRQEQQLLDRIPMGRFGSGADLTGIPVFLASRAASFVTGQVIAVDGGQTLM